MREMREYFYQPLQSLATICLVILLSGTSARAEPQHGIAMYGAPALPPDFSAMPYANENAPKGGSITLGNPGSYDSLNPFVHKGTYPWQLPFFTHESLMGRSQDEPFSLYGLLAESIETPDDRSWVEFTLRENARFSDGSPVTVEDVIFSYELLGTQGHPKYRGFYNQVEKIEQTGPRKVRITFNNDNRELALLAGMRPILSRTQWEGKDFAKAPLDQLPIGTGPYVVANFKAGQQVTLKRNPDYWGADVPYRRGTHNFDEIRIDFYGDANVLFEAFKAGDISAVRETNADRWDTQYSFPAIQSGKVVKAEIPHQKPSGMTGFAMNTRRAPFDDWRVRDALLTAFNFDYINETKTGAKQPRITSYFANSELAHQPGPPTGPELALLQSFADDLPPGTLEGYELPQSDGTARNRKAIRKALRQLKAAGYTAEDGVMRNADGEPLAFSILLSHGSGENLSAANIYAEDLKRLGVDAKVEVVDGPQLFSRTSNYDYDMAFFRRALSLSPGNEQRYYWGSEAADQPGAGNLPGVNSGVVDALINEMLAAPDRKSFVTATRALDRVLTAGRYVIPFWQYNQGLIAHDARMKRPDTLPLYGDSPTYMPELWWWQE